MDKRYLPSVEALTANDDELLIRELRLSLLRDQVEVARVLLDEVALRQAPSGTGHAPQSKQPEDQVAEELARVGRRLVELATSLASPSPH